jgi:hypothetical protein
LRVSPPISGAPRKSGSLIVPVRAKWRYPPNHLSKRAFIGPQPQPNPKSSQQIDQTIAFWNASFVNAQSPMWKKPG